MQDKDKITYEYCGIEDVQEFYSTRFAHPQSYDIQNTQNYCYDVLNLKQMYIYDYIKPNSIVLDFGCGSGVFKILKNLNTRIVGIDMSPLALSYAKELNDYDEVYSSDIFDSFYDKFKSRFDYVISSDVFGHIEFKYKDLTIARLKEFLKPDGVMIHGIETGDIDYMSMSQKERFDFASIDGHVAMESDKETKERFSKIFNHVRIYSPYAIINDLDEIIKQSQSYEVSYLTQDLIYYLKEMKNNPFFKEAFNISQFCTHKALEANFPKDLFLNLYGFSFILSSDHPIQKYTQKKPQASMQYGSLFYQEEKEDKKIFRWSPPYSFIILNDISKIELELSSYTFAYTQKEQNLSIVANGKIIQTLLFNQDLSTHNFTYENKERSALIKLEFYSDSSFTPYLFEQNNTDKRVLSFKLSPITMEKLI